MPSQYTISLFEFQLQKMEHIVTEPLSGGPLGRYVAIIDVIAGLQPPHTVQQIGMTSFGVTEISRALDLPKATASRHLHRLELAGLLERLPDRRYRLAARIYHWGRAAAPAADIRATVRPFMENLAERFGEPVSLFVLESDGAVCIDQVDGGHPIRLNAVVGRRLPLHTGSSPRLLLAFASLEQQDSVLAQAPYPALTPSTITDAARLRQALVDARHDGFVVSNGESNDGVVGIAVPIRDHSGQVRAALSIAGPGNRLEGANLSAILTRLTHEAGQISQALGCDAIANGVAT